MFEVGKSYNFRILQDQVGEKGVEITFGGKVIDIDGSLIKVSDGTTYTVYNTTSQYFISATRRSD